MDSIALCLSVSHVLSPHSHAQININLSYNKTRKERKQELISFQFLCDVRIFKQLALLAGCMHCVESFYFLFMRKKHTDWNNLLFLSPRVTVLSPGNWGQCFSCFFFWTRICAQRETWESRTYREHNKTRYSQTQILVPRFTRKQSKGGEWLVLTFTKNKHKKEKLSKSCTIFLL